MAASIDREEDIVVELSGISTGVYSGLLGTGISVRLVTSSVMHGALGLYITSC